MDPKTEIRLPSDKLVPKINVTTNIRLPTLNKQSSSNSKNCFIVCGHAATK